MTDIKEPIVYIRHNKIKKIKGIVSEQNYDGWFWHGVYTDLYGYEHPVRLHKAVWYERGINLP